MKCIMEVANFHKERESEYSIVILFSKKGNGFVGVINFIKMFVVYASIF